MLTPIQNEYESCCPNCGCVLKQAESYEQDERHVIIPSTVNMMILGSVFENKGKYAFRKQPQQIYEERVLRFLVDLTKEFGLPESLAITTFNELKRKKRGFQSENYKIPIKQLLQILSKDDYYHFFMIAKKIKAKYESIINR